MTTTTGTDTSAEAAAHARHLESEAVKMMAELSELSARLRQAGAAAADPASAPADHGLASLVAELHALQLRLQAIIPDGKSTLQQLDRNVRSRPYLFVLAALGLGYLLGKIRRS